MPQEGEIRSAGDMGLVEQEVTPTQAPVEVAVGVTPMLSIEKHTQRMDHFRALRKAAVARTQPNHWNRFGSDGELYLNVKGALHILTNVGGIRIRPANPPYVKMAGTDDAGDYYHYIYRGIVDIPGISEMPCQGIAGSRTKFYAWKSDSRHPEGGEWKPLSQVHEPNVMAHAHHAMIRDAVASIMGLRGITEAEAGDLGLDTGSVGQVEFRSGSKGGRGTGGGSGPKKPKSGAPGPKKANGKKEPPTQEQLDEIWALIDALKDSTGRSAEDLLAHYSYFKVGEREFRFTDPAKASKGWIQKTIERIKEADGDDTPF